MIELGGGHLLELLQNEIHEVDGTVVLKASRRWRLPRERRHTIGAHVCAVHEVRHPLHFGTGQGLTK